MGRETENQWRRREGTRQAIAELHARLIDPDPAFRPFDYETEATTSWAFFCE
jgi:hypothetical protein